MTASDPHPRKRVKVLDSEMSYVDVGKGDPIVFLHGNPTSSYLWRNIIPHVSDIGRCLAPDMIGMGQSGKSPYYTYRLVDHIHYLDAWFDAMNLSNVILVIHDWGSALGFHRASRYPAQIAGIAYMEAIVRPFSWDDFGEAADVFRALRSSAGEHLVLDENAFVERVLPSGMIRSLSEEEMGTYRAPYAEREARLGVLGAALDTSALSNAMLKADIILISPEARDIQNSATIPRSRLYQAEGEPGVASGTAMYVAFLDWRSTLLSLLGALRTVQAGR